MSQPVILSFVSTKGGVGKTTTAANLAGLLCDLGCRVLMVDADVQPSLTRYYPIAHRAPKGLTDMIRNGVITNDHLSQIDLRYPDSTVPHHNGCLDIVCSDIPDGTLEDWLASRGDRWFRLKHILSSPLVAERYDIVLIDTQGAVGALQQAAIFASSQMISPVSPDIVSAREFADGTTRLISEISSAEWGGMRVPPVNVLICKISRTRDSRAIAQQLRDEYSMHDSRRINSNITMLKASIPDAVAYREAATNRLPVHWFDPQKAGRAMHELLWELIPSLEGSCAFLCQNAFEQQQTADDFEGAK